MPFEHESADKGFYTKKNRTDVKEELKIHIEKKLIVITGVCKALVTCL